MRYYHVLVGGSLLVCSLFFGAAVPIIGVGGAALVAPLGLFMLTALYIAVAIIRDGAFPDELHQVRFSDPFFQTHRRFRLKEAVRALTPAHGAERHIEEVGAVRDLVERTLVHWKAAPGKQMAALKGQLPALAKLREALAEFEWLRGIPTAADVLAAYRARLKERATALAESLKPVCEAVEAAAARKAARKLTRL